MKRNQDLRVFLYIRVSTQEQVKEGYSIGAQEERLRAYAKARGYTIVKVYTDPGYSGANTDRPALQEMIKQIELGIADLVLVYKLDRLSRSQKDTLFLIEEVFLKHQVDFVSMNESFDTSTPFGRAMIGILSVFAQLEREQIRERTIMGKEARAKEGRWHGGGGEKHHATGYDYVEGELHIIEYEAECVKMIFDEYNKGLGVNKVLRLVDSKFPGVITTETTVRKILSNPLYTGKIRYKGNVYDGLHEPIITQAQFDQTQEFLQKRTSSSLPFRRSYLASGLIYCGHCGTRMTGKSGGKLKNGSPMRYYVCNSRTGKSRNTTQNHDCIKVAERKEKIEQHIIDEIKKLNMQFVEEFRTGSDTIPDRANIIDKEIQDIDKQISKLVDLYSLDNIPLDIMSKKMKKLKEDRDKLKRHLAEIKSESKLNTKNLDEIKKTVSQLATFNWDNEETDKKRLIVAKLINKIIVSNDNITIEWAF